jgi:hypothetical protein
MPLRSVASEWWGGWWDLQLGAIKGCLDYLGIAADMPSLAGGLGYAFIINVTRGNCPSGSYFSVSGTGDMLPRLGENLGYRTEKVMCLPGSPDIEQCRDAAKELTLRGIELGLPVYFWAAPGDGYSMIQEADDEGLVYGNDGSKSRKWREFDGMDFCRISPGASAPNWRKAAKDGIAFAVQHSRNPATWRTTRGDYDNFGLAAYDAFEGAIRDRGRDLKFGDLVIGGHWARCRTLGINYLDRLMALTDSGMSALILETRAAYEQVALNLNRIASAFGSDPEPEPPAEVALQTALEGVAAARRAEAVAIEALQEVGKRL